MYILKDLYVMVNVNALVLLGKIEHFVYRFLYISCIEIYFQCQKRRSRNQLFEYE